MSIRRAALLAAVALAVQAPVALAVEPSIYVNRSEWDAHLTGDGATGANGGNREFDVDETLDLDADERVSSLDSFLRVGKSRFLISWNQARYSGGNRLKDDLLFGGNSYPAGGRLRSVLHYERWRLLYGRPLLNTRKTAVGFLAGLEDYRVEQDARMSGQPDKTARIDERVPVIGGSVVWFPIAFTRVYGEVTATSISRGGTRSRLLSGYVRAEYDLWAELLAISMDYRVAFLDVEEEDEILYELRHRGVSFGLTLKFH